MNRKSKAPKGYERIARFLIGYLVGVSIFLGLVPFALGRLAAIDPMHDALLGAVPALARGAVALPLFLWGALFVIWSNVWLVKVGKGGPAEGLGVAISPPTRKLVTSGPYAFCRNPMIFGVFCIYISLAVFLASPLALASLFIFLPAAVFYLRRSEEKRLLREFGEQFREYHSRVPLFLPDFSRKRLYRTSSGR